MAQAMQETLLPFNTNLWNKFAVIASGQGERPLRLAAQLLREYIEMQEDLELFEEMRREARGRIKSDAEAVELVRQIRRDKKLGTNGNRAKTRVSSRAKARVT